MISYLYADSAFKHGVSQESIEHALRNLLLLETISDDPYLKELAIGIDDSGRLLEIITLTRDQTVLVIHAMKLRNSYLDKL